MARKATTFLTASVETQPMTVRISADLKEQLRMLEERLANEAPHLAFDRAQVVESALHFAVQAALAELNGRAAPNRGPASNGQLR